MDPATVRIGRGHYLRSEPFVPAPTVLVLASHPCCCAVCGGRREVQARCVDDIQATPRRYPCPHCGPLHLPIVYTGSAS